MTIVCENCESIPVECSATPAQLRVAADLGAASEGDGRGTTRTWIRSVGYGLVAVRHWYNDPASLYGYHTSVLDPEGNVIHSVRP